MSERSSTDLCGGRLATAVPTAIREHAKASQIPFVMLEDGLRAAEVRPLSILPDDADQIIDASGIFRNEW
jgi:capsule polysaccharide export protein KpsC/LpsZ